MNEIILPRNYIYYDNYYILYYSDKILYTSSCIESLFYLLSQNFNRHFYILINSKLREINIEEANILLEKLGLNALEYSKKSVYDENKSEVKTYKLLEFDQRLKNNFVLFSLIINKIVGTRQDCTKVVSDWILDSPDNINFIVNSKSSNSYDGVVAFYERICNKMNCKYFFFN